MKTITIGVSDKLYNKLDEIAAAQYKDAGMLAANVLADFVLNNQEEWGKDTFEKAFTR